MSDDTLYEAALRETIAENARLRSVMQQTEDAMNRACLRDGGSYWLPAPGHQVEVWSGNLHTALEFALNQQRLPTEKDHG